MDDDSFIRRESAKFQAENVLVDTHIKTYKERIRNVTSNITVEPLMASYILSCVFSGLAIQNLNLEKACRVNLNYSQVVCDALKLRQTENYTAQEDAVQKLTASINAWRNIVQTGIPCILIVFVGAWSDKTGRRKACMLTPLFGEILNTTGWILNTYFFYELPIEVSILIEICPAITGGWFTMGMAVFSYIGDITSEESRTFRVGVANLCMSLAVPLGMALSGVMLQIIGYYGIFFISGGLFVFSFVYGYFNLKDPDNTKEKRELDMKGGRGFLKSFFDIAHVKETMVVAFRDGPGNRRLRVTLLIIVVCVVWGPLYGEMSVMYLFTRYRFNWDEVQFSMFSTYGMVTHLLGTLFSISIFSNMMQMDDAIIGIISSMSKILSSFVYAFATTTLQIYMGPLIEIFNGTSFTAMRSIASKLVTSEELGKVNSLFGLAEAMMPLVYGPLYASTYMATINSLPGAVFLLGGAMTVPAVVIFGWFYFEHKNDRIIKEQDVTGPTTEGIEVKTV